MIDYPNMDTLTLSLDFYPEKKIFITVCGDKTVGLMYDKEVSDWFFSATGEKLDLIRKSPEHLRQVKKYPSIESGNVDSKEQTSNKTWFQSLTQIWGWNFKRPPEPVETKIEKCSIGFANESQFLLICNASIEALKSRLEKPELVDYLNFRPNIVIKGGYPFQEDQWEEIMIGDQVFRASGPCNRCTMICIDRKNLTIRAEPLKTLSRFRRHKGKILFGVLFEHCKSLSKEPYKLSPGMPLKVIKYHKNF